MEVKCSYAVTRVIFNQLLTLQDGNKYSYAVTQVIFNQK